MDSTFDRSWIPAIAFAMAMTAASLVPASGAGAGGFVMFGPIGMDKWLHAAGFAVLIVLTAGPVDDRRGLIAIALLAAALGGAIELAQIKVPGRTADPADWAADLAGIGLGMGIAAIRTRHERIRESLR